MPVYYNEIDPFVAQWLRNLIAAGHIAPGEVDERSIVDIRPSDLRGFTQCHFFAGIGVWSYALRLAGWPDDRPVWTGSCPCQTHSSAAHGRHVERDWWPVWRALIAATRPECVFGEQVAHARAWIGGVRNDVEGMGYRFGASNLPACGVGADHARPRIFFVCDADGDGKSVLPVDAKVDRVSRRGGDAGSVLPTDGVAPAMACLRAFGNAIHAEVARNFIEAYREVSA